MIWDKEKIKSILPQREPFLFIDEIIEIQGTQKVVAVKNINANEDFFRGHFPNNPIMPGVLIIESMAQATIILYSLCQPQIARNHPNYYLGKVKAEFLAPALPNNQLIITVTNTKIIANSGLVEAKAEINHKIIAKAELIFGVKEK
jgi:3-hydroxyacyl-[acyl-carrier-protein] dehydratase